MNIAFSKLQNYFEWWANQSVPLLRGKKTLGCPWPINMNHNKNPSFCEKPKPKLLMNKVKNEISTEP
jgi:hypothetical protein